MTHLQDALDLCDRVFGPDTTDPSPIVRRRSTPEEVPSIVDDGV